MVTESILFLKCLGKAGRADYRHFAVNGHQFRVQYLFKKCSGPFS